MGRLKPLLYILLAALTLWAAWSAIQARELVRETRDMAARVSVLQSEQDALRTALEDQERREQELLRTISELQSRIEEMEFKPLDIELDPELQRYTYYRSLQAGVPPEVIFALMWRESGYQSDAIGYNANGTTDHGLCQINSVNHEWLSQRGIDVNTPTGNIDACITILEIFMENYTLEESLAAYGVGESNMLKGKGFEAARKLLENI